VAPMAFAEKVLTEQESNGDPYAHEGHKPQPKPQAKPKTEKKPFSGEMKNPDDAATENQKDFIWKVARPRTSDAMRCFPSQRRSQGSA